MKNIILVKNYDLLIDYYKRMLPLFLVSFFLERIVYIPYIYFQEYHYFPSSLSNCLANNRRLVPLYFGLYFLFVLPFDYYIVGKVMGYVKKNYLKFWITSVICGFVSGLLTLLGAIILVVPGYYLSYRFKFLPFYVSKYYNTLNAIDILKLCWKEGQLYPLIDIFILDGILSIFRMAIMQSIEYLLILFIPMQMAIYLVLFKEMEDNNMINKVE